MINYNTGPHYSNSTTKYRPDGRYDNEYIIYLCAYSPKLANIYTEDKTTHTQKRNICSAVTTYRAAVRLTILTF